MVPFAPGSPLRHGLVGGVLGGVLTVAWNWPFDAAFVSLALVAVGGLLAGHLTRRDGSRRDRAGLVAGIVGTLPVGVAFVGPLSVTVSGWLSAGAVGLSFVVTPLALGFLFGTGALLGVVGARVGGWVAGRTATDAVGPPSS